MAKSKEKVCVEFVGKSADGVTGSMYYITYNDKQKTVQSQSPQLPSSICGT